MENNTLLARKCFFCGKTFYAKRPDAKYCSAPCRNRALRWRKRLERHYLKGYKILDEIAAYADYPDALPLAAEYLNILAYHSNEVMRQKGIKVVK